MDQDVTRGRSVLAGEGPAFRILGDLVTLKTRAAETDGAYTLFEAHTTPGQGMVLHEQRYDDEAMFVLEGTYVVQIGKETLELGPESLVLVPRETPHAYTNVGASVARLLILTSPGDIHEQFVVACGIPVDTANELPAREADDDLSWTSMSAEKYGVTLFIGQSH